MDLFETIKPINNSHVLFSFENAGTFNMKALTVPVFDDTIISNHTEGEYIFESLNGTILQNGASGPYRSYNVNYDSEGSMSLLELFKVHDYWKGPANVSRLMFDFNPNDIIEPTDGLLQGYTSLIAPTVKILHDSEGEPVSERLKEYKNSSNFHQVSTGITQTIWVNMDHPLVGLGLETPLAQYNEIYANWEPGKFLRNAISLLADRDEIVKNNYNINNKTIYYGVPAKTHWPSLINDKIDDLFLSFITEYNPHWAAYNIRTAGFIPIQTNQINVVSDIDDTMVKFVLNNGEISSYSEFEEAKLITRDSEGEENKFIFEKSDDNSWFVEMSMSDYSSIEEFQIIVRGDTTIGNFEYNNEGDLPCVGKTPWLKTSNYYEAPIITSILSSDNSDTQVTPFDISQLSIPILPVILSMLIVMRFRIIKKDN